MRVEVRTKLGLDSFASAASERLLYAGLRAGFDLPHECATGTCGNCRGTLLSGNVECTWAEAPARRFLRPGTGDLLLCQSVARSDCCIGVRTPVKKSEEHRGKPSYFDGYIERSGMLTHDVMLMELVLDQRISFMAGQFVVLELEGVEGFRAYSMVNYAENQSRLEFIVKKKPGGVLSQHLFSKNRSRLQFRIFGPLGRACFEPASAGDIVCVGGGTGVAGMMSILALAGESAHLQSHKAKICFGVRRAGDIFFLDRFAALAEKYPGSVEVTVATSDDSPPEYIARAYPSISFFKGLVHEAIAAQSLEGLSGLTAFVGGPPAAVDAATGVLLGTHRLSPTQIRFDRFG